MGMIDWAMVGGVGAAATALFTGYAIWQRAIDRPRPRWRFSRSAEAHRDFNGPKACVFITVTNVGDGTAFDVALTPVNTTSVANSNDRSGAASVATGESVRLTVHVPLIKDWESDRYGNPLTVPISPEQIGNTRVRITWNHPPHRWRKRRRTRRVSRLEP